jgi:hypothetical protein
MSVEPPPAPLPVLLDVPPLPVLVLVLVLDVPPDPVLVDELALVALVVLDAPPVPLADVLPPAPDTVPLPELVVAPEHSDVHDAVRQAT